MTYTREYPPPPPGGVILQEKEKTSEENLACVASVSVQVRRESWET